MKKNIFKLHILVLYFLLASFAKIECSLLKYLKLRNVNNSIMHKLSKKNISNRYKKTTLTNEEKNALINDLKYANSLLLPTSFLIGALAYCSHDPIAGALESVICVSSISSYTNNYIRIKKMKKEINNEPYDKDRYLKD